MTERRPSPRHAVVLPALCARRDGSAFHAVTVDMSPEGLKLRSATLPKVDDALTCHIRGVDPVDVRVAWVGSCDFTVKVTGRTPPPGDVARRLIELARQQALQENVARVSRRIIPAQTSVHVTLADGTRVPAEIINLSASGVALQIEAPVCMGETITVGRRQAKVARQNEHGVGAAFLVPFDEGSVGEHTVL